MWKGGRNFLLVNFGFFENKNFLSQGVCKIKFLFFEGLQRHVFTIIHQGFIILAGCGAVLEFFVNGYKFVL